MEKIVGYYPNDLSPYVEALTHKSVNDRKNYERLEFLGDAILDAAVAEHLFHQYPNFGEGELTQYKSRLVSRKNLNQIGQKLSLERVVISSFKPKDLPESVFGNVLEALVGAIYIESGLVKAQNFIDKHILADLDELLVAENDNYKGMLLEWASKLGKQVEFITNAERNNSFLSIIIIDGDEIAKGKGRNKKQAEQEAAKFAFEKLIIS